MGHPPNHFTGKERDGESGLDYFGARYYSSTVGRWFTPDWSATAVPVPYANLGDPQSLNLYSYVDNNPIAGIDPDGHQDPDDKPKQSSDPAAETANGTPAPTQTVQTGVTTGFAFAQMSDGTMKLVSTVWTSTITTTTDNNGNVVSQTTSTKTAAFSVEGGVPGQFLGMLTQTNTTMWREGLPAGASTSATISHDFNEAVKTFGGPALMKAVGSANHVVGGWPGAALRFPGTMLSDHHGIIQGGAAVAGGVCLLTPCAPAVAVGAFVVGTVDAAAERLHWW